MPVYRLTPLYGYYVRVCVCTLCPHFLQVMAKRWQSTAMHLLYGDDGESSDPPTANPDSAAAAAAAPAPAPSAYVPRR
jgi:hypothetical protein